VENIETYNTIDKHMSNDDIVFKRKTEEIYKVIVLGDPAVGKTELLTKFATNEFEEKYLPTIGVSILKEPIELKDYNTIVNLMFWDIAGQPQFYMLHRPYFNGADAMLLVFDITRSSTFSNINNWYNAAVKYGLSGIPRILIGNKAHLAGQRKIILPMAEHLAEKLNAHYYETSSLSGHNVKEVFEKIAELIYRSKGLGGPGGGGKLIIKPYQGKTIEVPEKIQPPKKKKKNIDSLVDPMWLWELDHFKKFPRPSSYIPQTQGSYVPQTNISKKEKKKLAKEKKREQKEKAKPEKIKKIVENREKQEKLIEDMKKSKKIKKEKQLEPFIPFTGRSKTKEEGKSKLRIIPNVEEVEADSNTFATKIAPEFGATSKKSTVDKRRFEELFEELFEEHEGIRGVIICDSSGLPIDSNMDIEISEEISAYVTSLIGKGKQLVKALKEGGLKFIRLETSKGEVMIALEEQLILIILKGEKGEKRTRDRDDRVRFPYPYIFTHPRPPDDFAAASQVHVRRPLKEKDPEGEVNYQYCGRKLTKEEQFTHSCKKKPEVNNI